MRREPGCAGRYRLHERTGPARQSSVPHINPANHNGQCQISALAEAARALTFAEGRAATGPSGVGSMDEMLEDRESGPMSIAVPSLCAFWLSSELAASA